MARGAVSIAAVLCRVRLKLNFVLQAFRGIRSPSLDAELACHYRVPRMRCIIRTRVMCQAGRARAADTRGDIASRRVVAVRAPRPSGSWCTRAPCYATSLAINK
jgi:hypothetical protein